MYWQNPVQGPLCPGIFGNDLEEAITSRKAKKNKAAEKQMYEEHGKVRREKEGQEADKEDDDAEEQVEDKISEKVKCHEEL